MNIFKLLVTLTFLWSWSPGFAWEMRGRETRVDTQGELTTHAVFLQREDSGGERRFHLFNAERSWRSEKFVVRSERGRTELTLVFPQAVYIGTYLKGSQNQLYQGQFYRRIPGQRFQAKDGESVKKNLQFLGLFQLESAPAVPMPRPTPTPTPYPIPTPSPGPAPMPTPSATPIPWPTPSPTYPGRL